MTPTFELDAVECFEGEQCPCLPQITLVIIGDRAAFAVGHKPNLARARRSQDGHP